jgi:hypothetical protein
MRGATITRVFGSSVSLSCKRIVGQRLRMFDKTSDDARGDIRAVLTDVSVNFSEIAALAG